MFLSFIGGAMLGGALSVVIMACFKVGNEEDAFMYGVMFEKAERGQDLEIAGIRYTPVHETEYNDERIF